MSKENRTVALSTRTFCDDGNALLAVLSKKSSDWPTSHMWLRSRRKAATAAEQRNWFIDLN